MKISRIPYTKEVTITQCEYGTYSHKKIPALDLVGTDKTIVSPCNGLVRVAINSNAKSGFGTYVSLQDTDNGNIRIILGHMKFNSLKVKKGDTVKIGQVIGEEGMTGYATGSHCHMEIRNSNGIGYKSVCAYTGLPNKLGKYKVSDFMKEINVKKDKYKVTALIGLRLRQGANTTSKVVRVLKYGTVIEADKIVNGFVKIKDGYLSLQYLKKV